MQNKDIDVLFYGSINPRRKYIIDKLIENKIKVKTLFGVYEKERDIGIIWCARTCLASPFADFFRIVSELSGWENKLQSWMLKE